MRYPSKTGHTNVIYREKTNDYLLSILRQGQGFYRAFNTIEEAIEIRDKVLNFYRKHGKIPNAQDLGLKRREPRLKDSENREKYISSKDVYGRRPYRVSITKDRVYFVQNFATLEEAIKRRDEVLEFYNDFDRLPNREEQEELFGVKMKERRHIADLDDCKSNTNTRNISFDKYFNRYQIQLTRKNAKFSAVSHTLEEAIAIRDNVLKFYDEHGRLPSKTEYHALLKKGTNL